MLKNKDILIEKYLCLFVPFLGLAWFIKGRYRFFNLFAFFINLSIWVGLGMLLWKYVPYLNIRFSFFGKRPLCNLNADRAPHIGGFVFILCYRCTFLILGIFLSFFFFYFKRVKGNLYLILLNALWILPCFFDGMLQLTTSYVSTNVIRSCTGFIAGIGIGYIAYYPFYRWKLFL